jgi:predicted phage-related endonuclease
MDEPQTVAEQAAATGYDPAPLPIDDLASLVDRKRQIDEHIVFLCTESDEIKAAIQARLGEREIGTVHGRPVVRWNHYVRTSLDQTDLRRRFPDVWADCRKTTVQRTFTLLDPAPEDNHE